MFGRRRPSELMQLEVVDLALAEMRALTTALRELTETLNRKESSPNGG